MREITIRKRASASASSASNSATLAASEKKNTDQQQRPVFSYASAPSSAPIPAMSACLLQRAQSLHVPGWPCKPKLAAVVKVRKNKERRM